MENTNLKAKTKVQRSGKDATSLLKKESEEEIEIL